MKKAERIKAGRRAHIQRRRWSWYYVGWIIDAKPATACNYLREYYESLRETGEVAP